MLVAGPCTTCLDTCAERSADLIHRLHEASVAWWAVKAEIIHCCLFFGNSDRTKQIYISHWLLILIHWFSKCNLPAVLEMFAPPQSGGHFQEPSFFGHIGLKPTVSSLSLNHKYWYIYLNKFRRMQIHHFSPWNSKHFKPATECSMLSHGLCSPTFALSAAIGSCTWQEPTNCRKAFGRKPFGWGVKL